MKDFHRLVVAAVREEIPGVARTVVFDVPEALKATFVWQAGQHVTLRFRIGGDEVRRSYSISSSPNAGDPLRITVKRVEGGLVSNHVNDSIEPGARVDVMAPFGGFVFQPEPRGTAHLLPDRRRQRNHATIRDTAHDTRGGALVRCPPAVRQPECRLDLVSWRALAVGGRSSPVG